MPLLNVGQISDETVVTTEGIRHSGGDWCGYFNNIQEANDWADRNPNSLFNGLRATISGTLVCYGGAGVGWVAENAPYGEIGVVLGDSITANNMSASTYAFFKSGVALAKNAGVAGETSSQILARFDTDVAPHNPTIVHIQAGTNDIEDGIADATVISNILEMAAKIRSIGARPIVSIPPPQNGAPLSAQSRFNELLVATLSANGIPFALSWLDAIDPLTGGFKSGAATDNQHPAWDYVKLAGDRISAAIGSLHRWPTPLMNQAGNGIIANPLMLNDTNADGVPDGWIGSGASTRSISTPSGFFGKAIKQFASAVDISSLNLVYGDFNISGDGHKVLFTAHAKFTTDGTAKASIYIEPYIGAAGQGRVYPIQNISGGFETQFHRLITLPVGTTKIRVALEMGKQSGATQTGTLEVGEIQIYNLTALGLT